MRKWMEAALLAALLLAICGCSQGTDARPAAADLPASPAAPVSSGESGEAAKEQSQHRIVSTTVAITEIMDALELDLVGIPESSKKLPDRYKDATVVGFVKKPDFELIRALKPTEVFSVSTLEYDLKPVFEESGVKASFLNMDSLDEMLESIKWLGEKYDRRQQADKLIASIRGKVEEFAQQAADKKKPTVLILMGIPGSYLVATENSFIGDLVKQLGGINVVQGEKVEYVASNTEYLHQSNPDIILRAAHGMPEEVIEMFNLEFKNNDIWKHFNAVKNNRVYDLPEDRFGTTGNLSVTEAMEELFKMMYPEE